MAQKRLLIMIYSLSTGGAERMVCELVKKLDMQRFEVCVMCCGAKSNTYFEEEVEKICKTEYLGCCNHIGLKDMLHALGRIRRFKPDIIHAHLGSIAFALPWSLISGKKTLVTVHTKPQEAFSTRNERLLRLSLRIHRACIAAISEENALECRKYFNIGKDACFCVNNGIDIARFYRKKHDGFNYINVARQDKNKNQQMLLTCFQKLHELRKDTKLYLVGDGVCHDELKKLSDDLKLSDSVVFTGRISNTEEYYAKADVYLQSSHVEGLPMSIIEAMAAGLPIISTNVGGVKDTVCGNGILVPDGDEQTFFDAMLTMHDISAENQALLGEKSLQLVKKYSSTQMANIYMSLYDRLA